IEPCTRRKPDCALRGQKRGGAKIASRYSRSRHLACAARPHNIHADIISRVFERVENGWVEQPLRLLVQFVRLLHYIKEFGRGVEPCARRAIELHEFARLLKA